MAHLETPLSKLLYEEGQSVVLISLTGQLFKNFYVSPSSNQSLEPNRGIVSISLPGPKKGIVFFLMSQLSKHKLTIKISRMTETLVFIHSHTLAQFLAATRY